MYISIQLQKLKLFHLNKGIINYLVFIYIIIYFLYILILYNYINLNILQYITKKNFLYVKFFKLSKCNYQHFNDIKYFTTDFIIIPIFNVSKVSFLFKFFLF